MRHFLRQHPEIYFPRREEQHHFEKDLMIPKLAYRRLGNYVMKRFNVTLENYLDNYRDAADEVILGDKTPTYLYSQTAAAEIFQFNPEAKLIAMFREPVSYMYSLHSQNIYNQYEDQTGFEKALTLEDSRKQEKNLSRRLRRIAHVLYYRDHTRYTDQLRRFVHMFPGHQIKCIIFEDFRRDNLGMVKEVYRFLGVDEAFTPEFKPVNPNKRRRFGFLKRIITPLAMTGVPEKLIPKTIYRRLREKFLDASTVYQPRKALDPELERHLKSQLKEEVIQFNDFLHEHCLIDSRTDLLKIWQYDEI